MSEVQPRNALNLWKNAAIAVALEGTDGQARMLGENNPLPVSFAPGATSDPDAAREATLQQVRDGITALAGLLGSTDSLETLLSTQTTYLDQVESLLTTLGGHTDGLEGLLSALGVKDDATLAKLEEIRVLAAARATETTLASVLTSLNLLARRTDTQPVSAAALPLPAGASTSALQTTGNTSLASILGVLQGTLLVRGNPDIPAIVTLNIAAGSSASDPILLNTQAIAAIDLGPNWTAADLTVDHSTDGGATWYPMYDTFGNLIQYRISANRSVVVPLADLMRRGRIRFRSGVPGAYVPQGVVTVLTLTLVTV
ncbi:hypothetical protein [Deinococcus sp. UR1]|uniref:hypothetical protein n=1 Tax=Deinococcus sp. UR1 TaxID=1704277 RepID=UPI000C1880F4|nr:hypothetical protein [Deinococcus sp. UR1]PIH00277.1 hypothetical protein AMD26_001535 [Deinococcus sp. UR1]